MSRPGVAGSGTGRGSRGSSAARGTTGGRATPGGRFSPVTGRDAGKPTAHGPRKPGGGPRTRRIAFLVFLVVLLGVLLAPTVHAYLKEKAATDALAREVDQKRDEVARLEKERAAWDDPRYVERQARERLRFVRPGERSYVVVNKGSVERVLPVQPIDSNVVQRSHEESPWYGEIWRSVKVAAAGPPGEQAPAPTGIGPATPAPTSPQPTAPTP